MLARLVCLAPLLAALACDLGANGTGSVPFEASTDAPSPVPTPTDASSEDASSEDAASSDASDATTSSPDGASEAGTDGGHTGVAVTAGGVTATSPHYTLTTTTGESPGGNGALSSPSYVVVGGMVGATQGN